eukprot:m.56440 g.56440  ORF g.56440 m.56440 type:complete len:358 (-) comp7677_c1_seq1:349-1422(-)
MRRVSAGGGAYVETDRRPAPTHSESIVMNPAADSNTQSEDDLKARAAAATRYSPPAYRRYTTPDGPEPSSESDTHRTPRASSRPLKQPLSPITPPHMPMYTLPGELPTPNFHQDPRHSIIIVTAEDNGKKKGCPFSGCDGCKDSLTCGYRRQYDGSLLINYLRSTKGLARPDLLVPDTAKHATLVTEAQQWDRDSSNGVAGAVIHKVLSSDTLQGLAIKYGTTTAAIRRENNMMGTDLISYRTLRIPTDQQGGQVWTASPGPRALAVMAHVALIEAVQKGAASKNQKVSFEEARVLLDLNDNDVDAAVAENASWLETESALRGNGRSTTAGMAPPSSSSSSRHHIKGLFAIRANGRK